MAAVILLLVMLSAGALVLVPRPLFAEAAEAPPPRRLEIGLGLALAALGVAVCLAGPGASLGARATLALALMALAAIAYSDFRFLIIPDLYSATLALIGLVGVLSPGLWPALAGAAICGGLLALVAWAFRRQTQVEGMGFGDVKLAAAIGALLGPQMGLWAVAASALIGALIGAVWANMRKGDGPVLLPYGAALALVSATFLTAGQL
jgi:prepilin signal peptidase PulO-like enzyme (type II secretory pathway)